MKHSTPHGPFASRISGLFVSRIFGVAFLAALVLAPAAIPVKAHAQEATSSHQTEVTEITAATSETPRAEENQEEAFLNKPMLFKIADALHMQEPTVRNILLLINFAIIFFAIVIPLSRMMPKIFRKRSQSLRFNLEEARKASEEARKRMSAVEEKLAGLDRDIASFRATVEHESLEEEKRIKSSIKEETERVVASAEQEINSAAAQARRSLKNFVADLAIENAARQLKLSPEADRALINEFIEQVTKDTAVAGKGGAK